MRFRAPCCQALGRAAALREYGGAGNGTGLIVDGRTRRGVGVIFPLRSQLIAGKGVALGDAVEDLLEGAFAGVFRAGG